MWNHNNCSRKFWDNFKCKCDQGKAIIDVIEFRVSKIIYIDVCIKVRGLWGWGFLCPSVSLSILRSAIVANAFSSDLKTHNSQIFPMIRPRWVAKISTSPKVTTPPPPLHPPHPSSNLLFHFRSVPERWPLNHFVLEKFDSSNGFAKSSNP